MAGKAAVCPASGLGCFYLLFLLAPGPVGLNSEPLAPPRCCCWWCAGELEEVHAVVRGELELIKKLGKEWFTTPSPDVPPEQLLRFSMKAGE